MLGNLHRHIRLKHPYVYFNETYPKTPTQDDNSSIEETDKATEQVFYIKEIDKINLKINNSEDDETLDSKADKIPDEDVEDTERPASFSEEELKIKNKSNTTMMAIRNDVSKAQRYHSWTRKYYHRINDNFIKCKICKRVFKTNISNTSNIHRHIKTKHADIYFNETYSNAPTTELPCGDSDLKITDKTVKQVFYIEELDKIVLADNNSQVRDDDLYEPYTDESIDNVFDVNETGEPILHTEEECKLKSSLEKVVLRKQYNTRSTRRYYSWTRKYYYKINDKSIKCKICQRVFKMNISNNGNILRHIKQKHPIVYFNETGSKSSTKLVLPYDSELKETDQGVNRVCKKNKDEIVTEGNNSDGQDDDVLKSKIDESQDCMSDVDEIEQQVSLTEEEINIKSREKVDVRKQINTTIDRRNRSWTRKYYYKINDNLIKCRICQRLLNMNIHRHIKTKHPQIYWNENPEVQELNIEEELRIKNLCENIAVGSRGRTKRSCFWNFFEMIVQDRIYQCNFCKKTIAIVQKNGANLKRHLITLHKQQYDIIMKYTDCEQSCSDTTEAAASEAEGVSSVEIAFLSLDDGNNGKFKCTRCDEIIEGTEEECDSLLIEHVQTCQQKPSPVEIQTDANIIKCIKEQGYFSYKFIPSLRGKQLLMFNGYTFSQNNHAKRMFYCSKKDSNCKCRIKLGCDGRVESIKNYHNHRPPKYAVNGDGMYLKISS